MNKMAVKGKLLVGPILALIGGFIMFAASFFVFQSIAVTEVSLAYMGYSWADVGFSIELMYLRFMCTLLWGVLGVIGGIVAISGKKIGSIIALLGGILGIVGMFVPLGYITISTPVPVSLSASFLFLDPILMILGGTLGLILKK